MTKRIKKWLMRRRLGNSVRRKTGIGFLALAEDEQGAYLKYRDGRRLGLLVRQPAVLGALLDRRGHKREIARPTA